MRFVCLVAALALGFLQATGPSRAPRNAAEFDELFKQVSNWGRWGKDDQLGSVNLITAAKRKQALALAKTGVSVSLAHNPLTERAEDNSNPFEHTMLRGNSMDRYAVSYHGYAHSHIDALCHILYKDQTYNGYPRAEVNTEKGCTKLGIDNLKQGIVSRGILIDAPRLKGVEYLEPGTPLYAEDVEAWEKKAGVKIGPGDIPLLYIGRWKRRAALGAWTGQVAGYYPDTIPWMHERLPSFIGHDFNIDWNPRPGWENMRNPIHVAVLNWMGINIVECLDLEKAVATARRLNRYEFAITFAPLPVEGGTGSPVNPVAIF
jgi:kynurenine formamidase